MRQKNILEKNKSNSSEKFEVPPQLKIEKEKNLKIYNQLSLLMKNKPIIYKDKPTELVKWIQKIVNLYKLIK